MKVNYYGHSCFAVLAGGKHLLFDPFISGNELAKDVQLDKIEADYIFVSHGHLDHMLDVVALATRTNALVLCGWELYAHFTKQGLTNVQAINPGGQFTFDFGTVKAVIAQHSSSFPDGTYAGIASGFVVKTKEGNFYYSGDTALSLDMALIPKWAELDFTILPIGDGVTMGVEDAIEAARFVEVSTVMGVHYNTFDFIKINAETALQRFTAAGLRLHLPSIGSSISL